MSIERRRTIYINDVSYSQLTVYKNTIAKMVEKIVRMAPPKVNSKGRYSTSLVVAY